MVKERRPHFTRYVIVVIVKEGNCAKAKTQVKHRTQGCYVGGTGSDVSPSSFHNKFQLRNFRIIFLQSDDF